jgi:hypothetical protein
MSMQTIQEPADFQGALTALGVTWPTADEGKIDAAGDAYLKAADDLNDLDRDANIAAKKALQSFSGSTKDSAEEYWENNFGKGKNAGKVSVTADACAVVGKLLKSMAQQVQQAKSDLATTLQKAQNILDNQKAAANPPTNPNGTLKKASGSGALLVGGSAASILGLKADAAQTLTGLQTSVTQTTASVDGIQVAAGIGGVQVRPTLNTQNPLGAASFDANGNAVDANGHPVAFADLSKSSKQEYILSGGGANTDGILIKGGFPGDSLAAQNGSNAMDASYKNAGAGQNQALPSSQNPLVPITAATQNPVAQSVSSAPVDYQSYDTSPQFNSTPSHHSSTPVWHDNNPTPVHNSGGGSSYSAPVHNSPAPNVNTGVVSQAAASAPAAPAPVASTPVYSAPTPSPTPSYGGGTPALGPDLGNTFNNAPAPAAAPAAAPTAAPITATPAAPVAGGQVAQPMQQQPVAQQPMQQQPVAQQPMQQPIQNQPIQNQPAQPLNQGGQLGAINQVQGQIPIRSAMPSYAPMASAANVGDIEGAFIGGVPMGKDIRRRKLPRLSTELFPLGNMPRPSSFPHEQLPAPTDGFDQLFEPADHPRSELITSLDPASVPVEMRKENLVAAREIEPNVDLESDELASLFDGYNPIGSVEEDKKWRQRFVVLRNNGRVEYSWPPNIMFPEGGMLPGEAITLVTGTEIDRFGTGDGRVFGEPGTKFDQRSLPPDHALSGYTRYEVVSEIPVWQTVIADWFGQPGRGLRWRATHSVDELVALGFVKAVSVDAVEDK